jgi:TANK-binding kinase 1
VVTLLGQRDKTHPTQSPIQESKMTTTSTTRETKSFVWDISLGCVLGRGQMGTVYKGSCKTTGEKVAIKALNRGTPQEYQMRELEQLSAIHHENILKLIAVEEEMVERKTVMILELCTGGSLLSYLNEPENFYGLEEDEVLLVLEHLEKGVKYLRENNILHRDLKPGMKNMNEHSNMILIPLN